MSEYMFGVSTKPITYSEAARRSAIVKKFGGTFVGPLTTAGNEGKCWYTIPSRGHPFDRETEDKILAAVGPDMEKFTIKRDGLPPLVFIGHRIASDRSSGDRYTRVILYKTQGGNFVGEVQNITCWQGERDHFRATSKKTATELIEWLRDGESTLGRISQSVVEDASKVLPEFASSWVEHVE